MHLVCYRGQRVAAFHLPSARPLFLHGFTYYTREDDRITVSCINFRTGEKKFYDFVTLAEWAAANRARKDNLKSPP